MHASRLILRASLGIAAPLLVLLGAFSPALAQERETPQELFEQIVRDPGAYADKNGAGEQFGWGINWYAGGFLQGYERTKDTAWLDGAVKCSDYCISRMRTGPDGYKGWIGDDLSGRDTWADNHVGDAIIVAPMLSFAEVVLKDPQLKQKYGASAQKYVELAERDLFEKWDKRGTWKEDRDWGCYIDWGMISTKAHPDV